VVTRPTLVSSIYTAQVVVYLLRTSASIVRVKIGSASSCAERVGRLLLEQTGVLDTFVANERVTSQTLGDHALLVQALNGRDAGKVGAVLRLGSSGTCSNAREGSATCDSREPCCSLLRAINSHPPQASMSFSMMHSHRLPGPSSRQARPWLGQRKCRGGRPRAASFLLSIRFFCEASGRDAMHLNSTFLVLEHPSTAISNRTTEPKSSAAGSISLRVSTSTHKWYPS